MNAEQIDRMRRDEPRRFDATVAECIHGEKLCRHERSVNGPVCIHCGMNREYWHIGARCYATDAAADLSTLEVCKAWEFSPLHDFQYALSNIWRSRCVSEQLLVLDRLGPAIAYRVGDYSSAALTVALSTVQAAEGATTP